MVMSATGPRISNRIASLIGRTSRVDRSDRAPLAYQNGTGGTASRPATFDLGSLQVQPCHLPAARISSEYIIEA